MQAKQSDTDIILRLSQMATKYQNNTPLFQELTAKFSAFSTAIEQYDLTWLYKKTATAFYQTLEQLEKPATLQAKEAIIAQYLALLFRTRIGKTKNETITSKDVSMECLFYISLLLLVTGLSIAKFQLIAMIILLIISVALLIPSAYYNFTVTENKRHTIDKQERDLLTLFAKTYQNTNQNNPLEVDLTPTNQ